MVPERHGAGAAEHVGEDRRHAHGQRRRAAGAREQRLFLHVGGERVQLRGIEHEAPGADHRGGTLGRRADDRRRRVDGEVDAGRQHAGGNERHDRHQRLGEHGAVADEARVGLALEHLGRGARGDERVEAGDGAAGDGDEHEGEELAGEHRARAVDEPGERRHLQRRQDDEDIPDRVKIDELPRSLLAPGWQDIQTITQILGKTWLAQASVLWRPIGDHPGGEQLRINPEHRLPRISSS